MKEEKNVSKSNTRKIIDMDNIVFMFCYATLNHTYRSHNSSSSEQASNKLCKQTTTSEQ